MFDYTFYQNDHWLEPKFFIGAERVHPWKLKDDDIVTIQHPNFEPSRMRPTFSDFERDGSKVFRIVGKLFYEECGEWTFLLSPLPSVFGIEE